MEQKVAQFYDEYANNQIRIGVNSRHLSIIDKLIRSGLKPHHRVLEIGCGIGTVSHLIAKKTPKGSVLAVDISPKSIDQARKTWSNLTNLTFEVSDMKGFQKEGDTFDFIVLPDVLEHIPVSDHFSLFETISRHSNNNTVIFIHIPAPRFLEWMIEHEPEKLQVIDQPLDTADLVKNISANDFYLEKMETYSVYYEEKDYQYFVFRKSRPVSNIAHRSKWIILMSRIWIRIKLIF
ncbi:class I SAM-dependent methyltransferase [Cyclobacterium sp.]|uniref:class I SAM-dependent methyltransferase n=1 Tax=Cyclobacterium sp. TaxID=1966343 RepID=UPI00198BF8E0|nr:class I SAM-dependent methyltransferase [Cyclobacterium sp.]MBD3628086.1 class I SAM-dependent methyltransferase [Cyclobacterium sp.]